MDVVVLYLYKIKRNSDSQVILTFNALWYESKLISSVSEKNTTK